MPTDVFENNLSEIFDRIAIGLYRSSIEGKLVSGNRPLARMFGFSSVDEMRAIPLIRLYKNKRDRGELIRDLVRTGWVEGRTIEFKRQDGTPLWCRLSAAAVLDSDGTMSFIDGILQDVGGEREKREQLSRARFQGVLEMAGGVVHRLNQPLTVITNLVNELVAETAEGDPHFEKILQVQEQVNKLNAIARKIGNVRKYKAMDYVAGVRIVDIDHTS